MEKASLCKKLPDGRIITVSKLLSPFFIYRDCKYFNRIILAPIDTDLITEHLVVIANKTNIRLCHQGIWPKHLYSNILNLIHDKENNRLKQISIVEVDNNIIDMVCNHLIKNLSYWSKLQ